MSAIPLLWRRTVLFEQGVPLNISKTVMFIRVEHKEIRMYPGPAWILYLDGIETGRSGVPSGIVTSLQPPR